MPIMGMKINAVTMEITWGFLKKLKIELPYESAVPLLGICPKKMKTLTQRDARHPCVHGNIIYSSLLDGNNLSIYLE